MNKDSYNKIIENWIKARNNAIVNKPILDFAARIKPEGNILDIGCGTGLPIAKYFSMNNFSITGIDASSKMIETAKSNKIENAEFLICDFFDFNSDQKFNGIIAWDSLFHFPKQRQIEIYRKVYDLLLPGGYFLFTHGKEEGEHVDKMFGESFYYSCLSRDFVLNLMTEIGFEIEYSIENFVEENDQRDWVVLARKSD
ncbi:class I SAM-dependent methyltransferase [Flavobacterium sp. MC2016-06]|jgi:2-polyprenyl-3-methyl-5-hydroxy-6-metoxy-1,4-benzoquinol methylase|uniref:class I SAM-dependent DNA methyltransferase n=1 Tax=Flavobacterium sp. MC2016-06 TaxID=2676308 RepID=UPI0012BA8C24|nr:class I SAM-dependent methyltransferase [Flavobacterium sp. MC2016-06]MBU3861125.1 class I SAM-dependent methyltransferase [Flavobacterium sp. MC2016-06]